MNTAWMVRFWLPLMSRKKPAAAQVLQCADGYAAQKLQEFGVMGMLADELAGVSMVMEHLIGLGHQKIAHISGELFSRSGLKRF